MIENTAADSLYNFNSNNCIRMKGELLVLCGTKVSGFLHSPKIRNFKSTAFAFWSKVKRIRSLLQITDMSTVVSVMNTRTKESIYQNLEVPNRIGQLSDFTLDEWRIVLFFGRTKNPHLQRVDQYLLQIRDMATFALLKSFVLPITRSPLYHFDYSNGFAVTGADDSPIRSVEMNIQPVVLLMSIA